MSQIKVGFVGYGGSAKTYHLPYLLPVKEFHIYAFLQRSAAPSTESAAPGSHCTVDFPDAKHYRTAEDFFADPAIELVIVSTHTDTHGTFAQKALEAGKHVVVEKPFTQTSEEADNLLALAKEKGVILTVYQNRRWDGEFRTLQHLVSKNAFGTITEAQIYYDFENPPWIKHLSAKYTPGSGLLFGLGSHTLDQALVLFGRPKSVTAFLKVLRGVESEVDDSFTVILQYETPLLVTVKTTIVSCLPQTLKYIVRGTEGSYVKYGDDIQERQILSGMSSTDSAFGVNPEEEYGTLTTYTEFDPDHQKFDASSKKYNGKYPTLNGFNQGYYESLADTIRRKAPLQVNPQTSRDGIRLMELARESHDTGRTVLWR
ncbi:hypothetical protein V500_04909 [Pseudogymnoascus sp. VKM F-4518 (FW-2643)]|nr:hypothetical protein V500_04909 [Pseudogymnoascus sp. VKM F-4518 (FW-2643)]KFZ23893.1 hypothetical protein V502_01621 [Pseudogymnoascus sp. VKM F-4520 (FW-2644)]